ncbi:sugar-binding transcriptional regulator [Enterococcus sp. MMGLQ5-2]|nr:sugar-binding transcriptional regulator [Enterococcus sp. MMGLQ5-2]MBS7585070.1 sugar-binding transcriptional regulator [Enterococcus sp. MMGLQ5-1]NPD12926.1 sugar-binding transcriptional regulator [Enterococcus sp. MMGLQ5-1]NPD37640.1 sugar-binding transcriptional regulator [Enterococcus sp. MMGLQ5-2]
MYYQEDMSQAEIAKTLGIYRTTISRMLTKAKQQGIVEIKVHHFDSAIFELETFFKQKFDLTQIEIVPTSHRLTEKEKADNLSVAAAEFIRKNISDDSVVGLSWGATIGRTISRISPKQTVDTVFLPIVGGPSHVNSKYHVNTLVYEMAKKFHGQSIFINATVIQESQPLAAGIIKSKYFAEIHDYWSKMDTVILGIGGPLNYQNSQWRDLLTMKDIKALKLREAVGDFACSFFDADGKVLKGDLYQRRIGIPVELIAKVPASIGIANGLNKAPAILGLIRRGYINSLITDQETALEMQRIFNENNA